MHRPLRGITLGEFGEEEARGGTVTTPRDALRYETGRHKGCQRRGDVHLDDSTAPSIMLGEKQRVALRVLLDPSSTWRSFESINGREFDR